MAYNNVTQWVLIKESKQLDRYGECDFAAESVFNSETEEVIEGFYHEYIDDTLKPPGSPENHPGTEYWWNSLTEEFQKTPLS